MINSEYNTDNYKFSKESTGTIIKDAEMLRLTPDHLKTKIM